MPELSHPMSFLRKQESPHLRHPAGLEESSQDPSFAVGVDLVHIPSFAAQLELPGTQFIAGTFTASEINEVSLLSEISGDRARHFAARFAAKEAFIKAWSNSLFGSPDPLPSIDFLEMTLARDLGGRTRLRLSGALAAACGRTQVSVSLSHDGDYAIATVVL